jgi:TatA/E family protein of Tat protein translocase
MRGAGRRTYLSALSFFRFSLKFPLAIYYEEMYNKNSSLLRFYFNRRRYAFGTCFHPEWRWDSLFSRIGSTELIIIFGIVLLIFGPSKLPQIGKSIGKGIREFRSATEEITKSVDENEPEDKKS